MPTASPSTVIQGLLPIKWRGLTAACGTADFEFAHAQAPRGYPLVSAFSHDWMGMDSIPIRVRLYFLNTVEKNSFPDLWERWRDALFDGTPGDLDHPVLGPMRAVVKTGSVTVSAQTTAGVVVDVSWEQTNENIDDAAFFEGATVSVIGAAAAAQAACDALGIDYPDGENDGIGLLDAVNAIESFAFAASVQASGAVNKVVGKVEQMVDAAERLQDPRAWVATTNLQTVWARLKDMQQRIVERAAGARPTKSAVLASDTALDAFAVAHGNTMSEIVELNPSALAKPIVPKGATLTYYA